MDGQKTLSHRLMYKIFRHTLQYCHTTLFFPDTVYFHSFLINGFSETLGHHAKTMSLYLRVSAENFLSTLSCIGRRVNSAESACLLPVYQAGRKIVQQPLSEAFG
jgi:hypothetical protein